jgi:hypothetical protein
MGYFSNGTEGGMYYEQYCSRCVHNKNEDCPVWDAHLLYSYRDCNDEDSILHMLIPRDGAYNGACRLFVEQAASGDLFALDHQP